MCENRFSLPKDEVVDRIISIVDRIITTEKGFTARLENGKLAIDADALVKLFLPASIASHRNQQTDPLGGFTNFSMHLDPPRGNQLRNPSEYQPRYGCNEIADNETLMLATRVRYGKISAEKDDLRYIHPNWKIPAYMTASLEREYGTLPKGELYVISDEKGEIKFKVEFGRGQKAINDTKKVWRKFKSLS